MGELTPEIWSPEEGRWTALTVGWKNGEDKFHVIFVFIGSIPIWAFGERRYYNSVIKYGGETWWAPHNLFREIFHFLGGLSLAACAAFNVALLWIMVAIVFIVACLNEILSDIPTSGLRVKNILDILFWTLGALSMVGIRQLL